MNSKSDKTFYEAVCLNWFSKILFESYAWNVFTVTAFIFCVEQK